jgi:hypothetical protein
MSIIHQHLKLVTKIFLFVKRQVVLMIFYVLTHFPHFIVYYRCCRYVLRGTLRFWQDILRTLNLKIYSIRDSRNWHCGSCSRVGLSSLQKYGRNRPNYKQKQCHNIVSPVYKLALLN